MFSISRINNLDPETVIYETISTIVASIIEFTLHGLQRLSAKAFFHSAGRTRIYGEPSIIAFVSQSGMIV